GQASCPHPPGDAEIAAGAWFSQELDLGEVLVGQSVTRKVSILNLGLAPVSVQESPADLTPFSTDLACSGTCGSRELPAHAELDLGLRFQPADAGDASQVAELQTSCGTIHVALHGQGIAPAFSCTPPSGGTLDFGELVQGTAAARAITCTNTANLDAVLKVEP